MELSKFQIHLEGTLLFTHFSKNIDLNDDILEEWSKHLEKTFPRKYYHLVIDLRHIRSIDRKGRAFFTNAAISSKITGIAFLIQNSSQKMYTDAIKMINRPPFPTAPFLNFDTARNWFSYAGQ